ncbi:ureidoglycolate lyase [Paraburkholderia hospita]|jgi:ureidoglycolate lyase|uniref:ureidoglycolate lyase n=1 Tax=Paraburkholderia hospita TaxID=169430 RepID=UPI0002719500|nr:ureidoglycolate lyase [Paraburkholderia hospita]EUC18109.1 Ureidoglycolate hydrolase [Burkholderia sp. BT03]SKC74842.1 ureidoglycolate lyase [Burkholderia sp. CF099]AXE98210.1 ureidoglycolate lyase [Paraburkholderia hospita]OUL72401.1 ureidoglycolate lyase [Paraburkholderia hospita]SKC90289.1 ureidoglycolate lyase [Paraburkholderia hospita]
MKTLAIEPLTREAFAPFGDVIELEGAKQIPINLGTTIRYHDLANVDVTNEGGRTLVNLFRGQARVLPFEITMMERHPLGSQAFIPLNDKPYLVVVAPAGELDESKIRAFVTSGWQGVNYAKGVWHHPLLALGDVSDFIVVDRGGDGHNLNEQNLRESQWLTEEAMNAVVV